MSYGPEARNNCHNVQSAVRLSLLQMQMSVRLQVRRRGLESAVNCHAERVARVTRVEARDRAARVMGCTIGL